MENESHGLILQDFESRVVHAECASEPQTEEMEAARMEIEDTKSVEIKASQLKSVSLMKDVQIKELEGELERLYSRSAENEKEFSECKGELLALLPQVEEKANRLKGAEKSVNQGVTAPDKATGEKEELWLEIENSILAAKETSVRIAEAEKERSAPQEKSTDIKMRMAQLQDKEQSLVKEIDMLSIVISGSIEAHDLDVQVPMLKAKRDSLNLEGQSMDMQGATSERLQSIQTLRINTDGLIT